MHSVLKVTSLAFSGGCLDLLAAAGVGDDGVEGLRLWPLAAAAAHATEVAARAEAALAESAGRRRSRFYRSAPAVASPETVVIDALLVQVSR